MSDTPRYRVLIIITFSVVAIMAVCLATAFSLFNNALRHSAMNRLAVMSDTKSELIDRWIQDTAAVVRITALRAECRNVLIAGDALNRKAAEAELSAVVRSMSGIAYVNIADKDGVVRASSIPDAAGRVKIPDRAYFQAALAGHENISLTYRARTTGKPAFAIAAPISHGGTVIGVIACVPDLNAFTDMFLTPVKVFRTGYIALYDATGLIFAHQDKNLIMKENLNDHAWGRAWLAKRRGAVEFTYQSEPALAYLKPCTQTAWTVVTAAPVREILEDVRLSMIINLSLLCIGLMTIMVITLMFRRTIKDLKAGQERIERSERKYRALTDQLPDIVYEADKDLMLTYVNRIGQTLTGYTPEDIAQGLPIRALLFEDDHADLLQVFERMKSSPTVPLHETHRIRTKTGGDFLGENNLAAIVEGGLLVGFRGVIRDVTEKTRMEQALIQSQKMETVGTLAGGLAHDFNNILGGIIGTVSLWRYELESGRILDHEHTVRNLSTLDMLCQRAVDIVQRLLMLARKQELRLEPVDLNGMLSHIERISASSFDKSIEIGVHLPDEPATVQADASQIEQAVLNVCINAAHAMTIMVPESASTGGHLDISLKAFQADDTFRQTHPEARHKDYWRISIADTGVGIDSALMSKIFLPFFSTKERGKGTGLGLSMVYSIVHQHQGFIEVSSTPGVGTRFSIFLPASDAAGSAREAPAPTALPLGDGLVLVIDDEENMRMIARSMLEKCGYTVMTATDGEEGLAIYRRHTHEIRAVLLDLIMPKLSGDLVYQALKKINPGVRILLTSGYRQDTRVDKALNHGGGGFISKPYDLRKLAEAMKHLLKDSPGPGPAAKTA